MSDHVASFVAAVLRDRAVQDVIQENDQLKESQSKAARVEITGEAGSPVYASGDIRQGEPGGQGERWLVAMSPDQDFSTCLLLNLESIQVRLGGIPLLSGDCITGANCRVLDFIIGCWDEEDRYGLFEFSGLSSPSIGTIACRCGPYDDYEHYHTIDNDQRSFQGAHMVLLAATTNPTMSIRFKCVELKLPNMLDCLERFGISREQATFVDRDERIQNALREALLMEEDDDEEDDDDEEEYDDDDDDDDDEET